MSKPMRPDQRPVDEVLCGSLADIEAGRVQDFDIFLAKMAEKVRQRADELQTSRVPLPVLRADR